jgi:hypothetical protein
MERGRKRGRERGSYQRRWWRRPAAPLRDGGRRATASSSSRRRWRRWPARDALPLLSAATPCSSLRGGSGVLRGRRRRRGVQRGRRRRGGARVRRVLGRVRECDWWKRIDTRVRLSPPYSWTPYCRRTTPLVRRGQV